MAVKMLRPQAKTIGPTVRTLATTPGATPRQRGRKWMDRRARWLSEHPLCVHCQAVGRVAAATQLDHIEPLWRGGADDESNYQGLCRSCHDAKTADEAEERSKVAR